MLLVGPVDMGIRLLSTLIHTGRNAERPRACGKNIYYFNVLSWNKKGISRIFGIMEFFIHKPAKAVSTCGHFRMDPCMGVGKVTAQPK